MMDFNAARFGKSAFAKSATGGAQAAPVTITEGKVNAQVEEFSATEQPPTPVDTETAELSFARTETATTAPPVTTAQSQPAQQAAPAKSAPAAQSIAVRASTIPAVIELAGTELQVGDWIEEDEGMGDLQRLGTSLPTVYLAYESSPQVKEAGLKAGLWTHSATGQQKEAINVVMVAFLQQRVLRQKYDQKAEEQSPAICVSLDGNTGSGSYVADEDIPDDRKVTILANDAPHSGRFSIETGRSCSRCTFATWAGAGKSRTKPACSEVYALVMHEAEWGPIVVRLKSTAIKPLRQWRDAWWPKVNTLAMQWSREHNGARVPAKLLAQVTIGTKPVERYYVPTFVNGDPTPDERLAFILSLKDLFDDIQDRLKSTEAFDEGDDHAIGGDDDVPFGDGAGTTPASAGNGGNGSRFAQRTSGSAFAQGR